MKNWMKLMVLSLLILGTLTACFHSSQQQKQRFDRQMMTVAKHERAIKQTLNDMDLNQLYHLSQTDTTDANKHAFKQIKDKIDQQLVPQMREYKKSALALPEKNKDLKSLKTTYLKGIKGKEKEIEKLKQFVILCQSSIQANENILYETQQFEKYRSQVETRINRAKQTAQGIEDSAMLEARLDDNNRRIKEIAETSIREKKQEDQIKVINNKVIPFIQELIKSLNETKLKDDETTEARQYAVQMYYSLEHYYEERAKTITYNQKLAKIDVHTLITKGVDLEKYNQPYENQRDQLAP